MSAICKTLAWIYVYIGLLFAAGASNFVESADQFDPSRVVVLATGDTPELAKTCAAAAGIQLEGAWQPLEGDLARLRRGLSSLLVDFRDKFQIPKVVLRPSDYHLQLCPVVGSGRRVIFVSGFHKVLLGDKSCVEHPRRTCAWRTQVLGSGHSGGKQFWTTYDPNKDQFERFTFDGSS